MRSFLALFLLAFTLLQFNTTNAQQRSNDWRVVKKIFTASNGQKFNSEYDYSTDGRIQAVRSFSGTGILTTTTDNFQFGRNNKPSSYIVNYNRERTIINVSLQFDNSGRITELVKTNNTRDVTTFTYRYTGSSIIITEKKTTGDGNVKDGSITLYTEHGDYEETIADAASQTITSTIRLNQTRNSELEPWPDNFMGGFEAPKFFGTQAYGNEPQVTAIKNSDGLITSLTLVTKTTIRKYEYTYTRVGAVKEDAGQTGTKIIIATNINCPEGKQLVERILKSQDGVFDATVDIRTGKLSLDYSPDGTPYAVIIKAINDAGFDADRIKSQVPNANPCKATTVNTFSIANLKKIYQLREASASPELKQRLMQQRSMIAQNGFKYQVANTGVSEHILKDITGFSKISRSEILRFRDIDKSKLFNPDVASFLKDYKPIADASLSEFDARNYIRIPPIREQKCASCWAYGTVGLLEISYMAQKGYGTTSTIDLSEKQVLGCSAAGTCNGGWHFKAFEWMKNTNQKLLLEESLKDDDFFPKKSSLPDAAFVDVLCNVADIKKYFLQLADWGIIQKDKDLDKVADEYDIKEAVVKYGAAAVSIYASPVFQSYASAETFEEEEIAYKDSAVNHIVIIIGWDNKKQAWLIRNSWGRNWGDDGYGWIKFTTNHIGKHAIWAVAKIPQPLRIPLPGSINTQPVTLTGELLPGHQFSPGSILTSPNGKYELNNSNNVIWFISKFEGGAYSSEMINPFNDFNSIHKLYSNLAVMGSAAKSPFYLEDNEGNLFTPFGTNPFGKLVLTDSGNLIAYGKDESILWSLKPVPPKIRRK